MKALMIRMSENPRTALIGDAIGLASICVMLLVGLSLPAAF